MDTRFRPHSGESEPDYQAAGSTTRGGSLDKGWLKGVRTGMGRGGWASISRTV